MPATTVAIPTGLVVCTFEEEFTMVLIRTRGGAGCIKYQVIVRHTNEPDTTRSFRKLSEAKAWADREKRKQHPQ